jgi:hypothetical protein
LLICEKNDKFYVLYFYLTHSRGVRGNEKDISAPQQEKKEQARLQAADVDQERQESAGFKTGKGPPLPERQQRHAITRINPSGTAQSGSDGIAINI